MKVSPLLNICESLTSGGMGLAAPASSSSTEGKDYPRLYWWLSCCEEFGTCSGNPLAIVVKLSSYLSYLRLIFSILIKRETFVDLNRLDFEKSADDCCFLNMLAMLPAIVFLCENFLAGFGELLLAEFVKLTIELSSLIRSASLKSIIDVERGI